MTTTVGRNDPCPCGSGEKYKNCCEGKLQLGSRIKTSGPWLWIALGAVGLVVAAVVLLRPQRPAEQAAAPYPVTSTAPAPSASAPVMPNTSGPLPPVGSTPATSAPLSSPTAAATPAPASGTPQPWQYDAASNRHWDPSHGHWHDGPPPPVSARGGSAPPTGVPTVIGPGTPAAGTPAPWTYDAAKNQHWDPTHNHWHPGPPPTNR